jgi:hypothetical protein
MKMSRSFSLLFLLVAGFLFALPKAVRADVSFDFFYDSLAPHGEWIEVGDYGYCWRPADVDAEWAPYSDGYWTYTDAGWTWVSYEDWGGITYHYGRWAQIEDEGWCWVPGTEWGPAWVSWRNSDDYIGWAPLPPEARWQPSVGFSVWVDNSYDIGPGYYNFCHSYDFGVPFLRPCILPRRDNVTIINKTVNITNITYNNVSKVVYNGGPDFNTMNRRSRRPIPALKLVQRANVDDLRDGRNRRGKGGLLRAEQRGNQLEVVSPTIAQGDDQKALKPKKIAKVVSKDKVNKGWASVKDPEQRRAIKQQMEQQTRNLSPETAPAKPVQVADLEVLPKKADPNAPSPVRTGRDKGKGNDTKIAGETAPGRKGKDARDDGTGAVTTDPGAQADADNANKEKDRKGKGRNKADAIGVPVPVTPDAPVAATERDLNGKREGKGAGEGREKSARENAANRQPQRDADEPKKKDGTNADERAVARRRALEKEMARDDAELAAARARRQQAAADAQEEKRQRQQRADAIEERGRQRSEEERAIRQRQNQNSERDAFRQQAAQERQVQAQREMQRQRVQQLQQHQQQQQQMRALENQRAAQQQRQLQIQRQQPQQSQPRPQAGGGGGHGGGKRQLTDEEREQKKQRGF